MSTVIVPVAPQFVDRRESANPASSPMLERRQFANSYTELSAEARALANAVDRYKLRHRRRFINYEEMLGVIKSLGYRRETLQDGVLA